MRKIILASASPRRRELLARFIREFDIIPADIDESVAENESPRQYVRRMAIEKRDKVAATEDHTALIIAADTTVVCEDKIYGKPESRADAVAMLKELRAKEHCVITGVACKDGQTDETFDFISESYVSFCNFSDETVTSYVATGEADDKAGAYAIQGIGCILVESIKGDYDNIVGLPIAELVRLLAARDIFLF